MKIIFLTVPSSEPEWFEDFSNTYSKKIRAFFPFEMLHLKPNKKSRSEQEDKKKKESEFVLATLESDDYVVLFDERGKVQTSEEFAKTIEKSLNSGKKRLVFIIGGAFGVDDSVRARAQVTISLSGFVLNHVVAQVVALEQIYRAFTIRAHIPYHNS